MHRPKRRKRTYKPIRRKYIKTDFVFTENEIQNVKDIYKRDRDQKIKNKGLYITADAFLSSSKPYYLKK